MNGEKKICPLLFAGDRTMGECVKEKCMWWDRNAHECSVPIISFCLVTVWYEIMKKEEER